MNPGKLILLSATAALLSPIARGDTANRPDDHAPIGVMGDHYHEAGELMLSYRFMTMSMQGNRDGTDDISPGTIVTTVPNRLAGQPMQPPTLRVIPTEMTTTMHMVGAMYAPADRLTLMVMTSYVTREMDHVTFQGPAGTTRLGTFTTRASGIGDSSLTALVELAENPRSRWHAILGLSLPTGSTDESDTVLAPTGMRPELRLPYPMQLGSGTRDAITGLTYTVFGERWSAGGQWRSVLRIGENDEEYTYGDEHRLTGWVSYPATPALSLSARLQYFRRGDVDGGDPLIRAPVQTADPERQGARRLELGVGLNWAGRGAAEGHRVGIEAGVPVYQDLNGPQLETDWMATAGYQYTF